MQETEAYPVGRETWNPSAQSLPAHSHETPPVEKPAH